MTTWTDEYTQMLTDCQNRESRLNEWERQFVQSLGEQIENDRTPTPKQIETLDNIWEKATKHG